MKENQIINEMANRLVNVYHPVEIYLFGSHAWGKPDAESDIDLLIVVESLAKDRYEALTEGHRALRGINVPKDLLILDKKEFDLFSTDPARIFYKIKKRGIKIYARA